MSPGLLHRLERTKTNVSAAALLVIANTLCMTPAALCGRPRCRR
ncbi:hypothetical protein [Sorangium sp. So ce295]